MKTTIDYSDLSPEIALTRALNHSKGWLNTNFKPGTYKKLQQIIVLEFVNYTNKNNITIKEYDWETLKTFCDYIAITMDFVGIQGLYPVMAIVQDSLHIKKFVLPTPTLKHYLVKK